MHVLLHPINFSMLLKLIYNKASETVVIDMPQICFFSSQNMYFINKNFFNLSDQFSRNMTNYYRFSLEDPYSLLTM